MPDPILAATLAALTPLLGYRTGRWTARRWHTHRTIRDAQHYLRYPQLRPVIDHFHQPRKEN